MERQGGTAQDRELAEAARIAIRASLGLRKDEKVLIITNPLPDVLAVSNALFAAALEAGGRPTIMIQAVKAQMDFAEEAVIAAFESQPDVVISISAEKLGKDREGIETPYEWDGVNYDHILNYLLHGTKTIRAFWSPSVTVEMFAKTVPIDYSELRGRCARIKKILDAAVQVRVTNAKGSDIVIGLEGREARMDDGNYSLPGLGGNLPAGEVFISPALGSAQGTIVFDGSIADAMGDIVIREPIRCRVEGGLVVDLTGGGEAAALARTLEGAAANARRMGAEGAMAPAKAEAYARNARSIGELGIGLNPRAGVVGNMLEDEKAFRTCHFAIGSNYDDDAPALIHLDGLVSEPTIVALDAQGRETLIERAGELLV
jgi:leucyl aminopeptidase (aminopeptidase T)